MKTATLVYQVQVLLRILESDEKQTLEAVIAAHGLAGENLNIAISRLIQEPKGGKVLGFGTNYDQILDAWGEPLRFEYVAPAPSMQNSQESNNRATSILVWSKGPNKVDEHGNGDDVTAAKFFRSAK